MSLPVFVARSDVLAAAVPGSSVELTGPEARHAVTVRRMAVGERLDLVDGHGRRVTGTVSAAARAALSLDVESVSDDPAPDVEIVLVQALAKGEGDDRAIETATELGVDAVVPWQAQRSIVQWRGERGEKARATWVDTVTAAAKQSRRSRFPVVEPAVDLRGLVRLVTGADAAYVLHEDADAPLAALALPASGRVLVVVGPEGGIAPAELAALAAAGGQLVRLGHTVLRSSSAGPAALAVLSAASRWC